MESIIDTHASPVATGQAAAGPLHPSLVILATARNEPLFESDRRAAAVFGLTARHPATAAACLLPQRLEWVLLEGWDVEETVRRFQAACRRLLEEQGTRGAVWQRDFSHRPIASAAQLQRTGSWVLDAPVREGLVVRREDYRWHGRFAGRTAHGV